MRLALALSLTALPVMPAAADLVISQVIIEFSAKGPRARDIEVLNTSEERSFVAVEPAEIVDPGTRGERRVASPDPAKLGLLISPTRFVLEPHQRRRLRIASIGPATQRERVYRVTVKPVAGKVSGTQSGLKLLVGYDLLVLVRPPTAKDDLRVERLANAVSVTNLGVASVELAEGKQCDAGGSNCQPLAGKRLYAGASWQSPLRPGASGEYQVRSMNGWSKLKF
jgi:P pilus assembly chaperone PapD